jgi:CBS domain-containing protein/LmbE family N-acetylglucosaminyl deacetylase
VLAVVARPGDESYYLGAILDSFRAQETKVSALVFSMGEASPYNSSLDRLESVRPFEFELATFVLRASYRLLIDYPDGGLARVPLAERVERVTRMIRECAADLLLVVDGAAADHAVVEAAYAAGRAAGIPVLAWTLPADVADAVRASGGLAVAGCPRPEIDFAVQVSRKVQQRAMSAHRSQAAGADAHAARFGVQGDREWLRWLVPRPERTYPREVIGMLVREVMSAPVVTVSHIATVKQAIRLLYERNITAAPVVDGHERVVGIVSEMDLLRDEFEADPRAFVRPVADPQGPPPRRVDELMTHQVMTVRETTDAAELVDLMMTTGVKSVPVLRGTRLVGMVSRRDLMGVLARSDERIKHDVVEALTEYDNGGSPWEVTVRDGIVELRGRADVATEHIADVITRTIPGVLRVAHRSG